MGWPESEDDRPGVQAKHTQRERERERERESSVVRFLAFLAASMIVDGSRRKGKTRRARCFVQSSTMVEAGGTGAVEACPGGGEARPGRGCVRRY